MVWAAVPVGFLATAIIVVNNLRDRKTDVKAQKLTMAVRFGATFARVEYTLLVALSYVSLIAGALLGRGPAESVWWLLPWLSAPVAASRIRGIWELDGAPLNPFLGKVMAVRCAPSYFQATDRFPHCYSCANHPSSYGPSPLLSSPITIPIDPW